MKKSILSMAVVAVSLFTFGAMAQTSCTKKCDKACDKKECCKGETRCDKEGKRPCPNPFEGINLTQEQKDKLKDMAPCKKQEACKKKQRECRDSVARAERVGYLKNVKGVLTPEQYVQFLENMFVNPQPQKSGMGRAPRHHRGEGPCMKAPGDCKSTECPKAQSENK